MPEETNIEALYQEVLADEAEETTTVEDSSDSQDDVDLTRDDEDDDHGLRPDGSILDALGDNAAARKRLLEQFKGLDKIKSRWESAEVQNAIAFADALKNPDSAKVAIKQVQEALASHYGWIEDQKGDDIQEFQYETDRIVYEKAKRDAINAVKGEVAKLEADLLEIKKSNTERTWLDANGDRVKTKVEQEFGWKVTDSMLREARANFPNESDVSVALKRSFPDQYAEARLKKVTRPEPSGKPMVQGKPTGQSNAKPPKDMDEAFDLAYAEMMAGITD